MSIPVVFSCLVMLVICPRRGQFLKPFHNVFDQAIFQIVDVDCGGDMHWRHKTQAVLNPAPSDNLLHKRSDVYNFSPLLRMHVQIFRVCLHGT